MGVLPQYSGGYRRKMGFSNCVLHNWGSWTLSLSSSGEVATDYFSPTLCRLREGVMLAKFLLPSPVALTSPPPRPPSGVLESFLEKPGLLPKALSSVGVCPSQHSPEFFQLLPRRAGASHSHLLVTQRISRSVCLLLNAQVGDIPPGSLGILY